MLLTGSGAAVAAVALAGLLAGPAAAGMSGPVVQVSADPYTNPGPQHATEVEPDTAAAGQTVVSVFQVGRWDNGCSDNIGWATSHNRGVTWAHGFLPGLTAFSRPKGQFYRASDPSIAYGARFGDWVASSLPCNGTSAKPAACPGSGHHREPVPQRHQVGQGDRGGERAEEGVWHRQELGHLRQLAGEPVLRQLLHGMGRGQPPRPGQDEHLHRRGPDLPGRAAGQRQEYFLPADRMLTLVGTAAGQRDTTDTTE